MGPGTATTLDTCAGGLVELDCDAGGAGLPSGLTFELVTIDGRPAAEGATTGYLAATVGSTRGFVCDPGFGASTGDVACRQMFGYDYAANNIAVGEALTMI